MIGAKIHYLYLYLHLCNVLYIRGSPILSPKVFLSVPKRNFVVCTRLVVHLYVVEDVEELLPCLDLVERNRHDVALGVVRNCLEVEAKDFQENNFITMSSLYAEQADYF